MAFPLLNYGCASILASFALLLAGCAAPTFTANQVEVRATDVSRFFAVVDALPANAKVGDVARALEDQYLAAGSEGLAGFVQERIGSAKELAERYVSRRAYYQQAKPTLLRLAADASVQTRVRAAFARINEWIPEARFPHTYLVVGRMNSAGTTGSAGLLIGIEMFGRTPDASFDSLNRWARFSLHVPEDLVHTIVHESIHTLQRGSDRHTLLEAAIHEGMCDFIASLATGTARDTLTYRYARANERALWLEFTAAMHKSDWDGWLYSTPSDTNRPPDLGYAVGYLICSAYYDQAADKAAAVRAMLELRDAEAFLKASRYDGGN